MTEAMPFLQNYDITFLRHPPIAYRRYFIYNKLDYKSKSETEG